VALLFRHFRRVVMIKLTFKVGGRTFSNSRDAMRELGRQVQKNVDGFLNII
jgi:hypothetical protein